MGVTASVFMTQAEKEKIHENMTVLAKKLVEHLSDEQGIYMGLSLTKNLVGDDAGISNETIHKQKSIVEKLENELINLASEWKRLDLPLVDGKIVPHSKVELK